MSELTLDEAIKHCLEVAEENDLAAETYEILAENNHNAYERLTAETNSSRCAECAADHRQLTKWLTELKEAKRLLKLALNDFETIESNLEYDEHCVIKTHSIRCDECPLSAETIYRCKWRYAAEALKLIGEDEDT